MKIYAVTTYNVRDLTEGMIGVFDTFEKAKSVCDSLSTNYDEDGHVWYNNFTYDHYEIIELELNQLIE